LVQAEVELRKMEFVVAVAEERNFTRAATRCHVSQPALSRQVREVEEMLGTGLFERQPRRIVLTGAGRLFVREAKRGLEQSRRTVSLVRAFAKQETQPVHIGVSSLLDPVHFHTAIEQARRAVSIVSILVHTANTPELIRDLLRGDLDLAFVDLPVRERGLRVQQLFSEPLTAVVPERFSSTFKLSAIQLADLRSAPIVLLSQTVDPARTVIDQALSSVGNRSFKIHDAGSVPELLDQVAMAGRIGLLRQSATRFQRHGVAFRSLADSVQVGCALAWRIRQLGPRLASFRDTLIHFFQQS
jgi:DNA-binding transcriptional LysR family regulator